MEEELTDSELVHQVQAGSQEAYRELVSRYKNYVFSLIGRQLADRETAEELTQDVFIKVYRALGKFRGEAQFKTWITRIALNTVHSYFRSKRYNQKKATSSIEDREAALEIEQFDHDPMQRKQITQLFKNCFSEMKSSLQEVIALCGFQEQSYEEVAKVLEIPIGTVRSRLNRARLTLKECCERKGVL